MNRTGATRAHDVYSCHAYARDDDAGGAVGMPTRRAGGEISGAVFDARDAPRLGDVQLLSGAPIHKRCKALIRTKAGERRELLLASAAAAATAAAAGGSSGGCVPPGCELAEPIAAVELRGDGGGGGDDAAATAAAAPPLRLVAAYAAHRVFVDAAATCDGGGNSGSKNGRRAALPVVFNYTHILRFAPARYPRSGGGGGGYSGACGPPADASVPQYEDRVRWPATHYQVFKPRGVSYHRLLVVADALASDDARFLIAEGLPALAAALRRLPRLFGRVLLRDAPATDVMMAAAGALPGLGLEWRGHPLGRVAPAAAAAVAHLPSTAGGGGGAHGRGEPEAARRQQRRLAVASSGGDGGDGGVTSGSSSGSTTARAAGALAGWRSAPWAAPQLTAPYLAWAHQLVALTADAPLLSALPLAGRHFLDATAPAAFEAAARALAGAAAEGGPAAPGDEGPLPCVVAAMGAAPVAALAAAGRSALPRGWRAATATDAVPAAPEAHAAAVRGAGALLVDAAAPPLYLALARRGATLAWLLPAGGAGGAAARRAAVEGAAPCRLGIFRCAVVEAGGGGGAAALRRGLAAALDGVACAAGDGEDDSSDNGSSQ